MLNPIHYAERVVSDFLRYQLTTYPFADPGLHEQMRRLLSLEETRATPLLKGPYISLSRAFREGPTLVDLVHEGLLHPLLPGLALFPAVYGHQETALRHIHAGKSTVISTGTGSGKTECFLYPIISRCLALRDEGASEGIVAVIVYPMNALAEDQLGRLRELLAGTGITFGMYVGKTPDRSADVIGVRLPAGASRADYLAQLEQLRTAKRNLAVHPPEERASRQEMRTPGLQPRILLTNVKQLELLLTRQQDVELFEGARLDYLVFDEAHTFSGVNGAETACLIRRLRTYCGRKPEETVCIATSATISDPDRGPEAAREFAARFFGVRRDRVDLVSEEYQPDLWSSHRATSGSLPGNPAVHLQTVLDTVTDVQEDPPAPGALRLLRNTFQALTGSTLDVSRWQESLYDRLASNETAYQISEALRKPLPLCDLVANLRERLGRELPEEEILIWLALGAASRKDGRALLRPVVHAFIRGVGGAVVTFPCDRRGPRLWLSAEDAAPAGEEACFRLPILTCTTCGQHYFEHYVRDFSFTDRRPFGGEAIGNHVIWRALEEQLGGSRVVLLDRLVLDDDDDGAAGPPNAPRNSTQLFFCRYCGTLHDCAGPRCEACGKEPSPIPLFAVRQKANHPGELTSCLACGAIGHAQLGRYREPARRVRATAVSDVHVLAQSMIHHAERRRLLVFADNRQDAAFQAGWMQDHARRYRLRALMYERLLQSPVSVGDLVAHLEDALESDDDLSRALIPEVWRVARKESAGQQHAAERKYFLRIQVLREIATGIRQRIGLEPWGRLMVEYRGLIPTLPFFSEWAARARCSAEELRNGVASLLDVARRGRILLDRDGRIFSKFWHEGEREIQRGYVPLIRGGPKALKLHRATEDDAGRIQQWISNRGQTAAYQSVLRWGIPEILADDFFEALWTLLTSELALLMDGRLSGWRGNALPGTLGGRQIDADLLTLQAHHGLFRCSVCRRPHLRATPHMTCTALRCAGALVPEPEDPDDYDLMVLDQRFAMIRPREHSAQIPQDDREVLERMFKGESERVNTLVCTPTLELGVDIGALDSVLMRNVPPLPSNYWQRAGRAGRRYRMAVDLTYARPASHDRAYFADPLKMLEGEILPPSFNLKNDLMVRKHAHATVLTVLHRMVRDEHLEKPARVEIEAALKECFPTQVREYLFDSAGYVRRAPFDLSSLTSVVAKHDDSLLEHVRQVFESGWPEQDRHVVEPATVHQYISEMPAQLGSVIGRLARRLNWALDQMDRLDKVRTRKGTLDPDEDSLRARCDRLVKKLKGAERRRRRETEGYDDTNTYSVLAAEGFLPGYGLDTGWVVGTHQAPLFNPDIRDWDLRRSPAVALREYIPGNLVYANGHRFLPRFFRLEPVEPTTFQVDTANDAVVEVGVASGTSIGLGATMLRAVPICDVELPHNSQISDEEDYRFQLSVALFGYEQPRHGGGKVFQWGPRQVTHRTAVRLRIVNVGPTALARNGNLGYPVCLVCGQSRSPLASQADRDNFAAEHLSRCGRQIEPIGFYADIVADAITIPCANRTEAFSVAEALRFGAAQVLEMEAEDLQLLAVGRAGQKGVDMTIYDPMPGGSGLLEQMTARWPEVVEAALGIVRDCPAACNSACVDCLLHFRNAYYHRYLDRKVALAGLEEAGDKLSFSHELPPLLPADPSAGLPVNDAEQTLKLMLERAGFRDFQAQHNLSLGRPLGSTTPDFFFEDPNRHYEGICIYLDGMSAHIHGNPQTHRKDRQIREELRNRFYEVIEIPFGELTDREAMRRHFFRLGRALLGRDGGVRLRDDPQWFDAPAPEPPPSDEWEESIELLDEEWRDLVSGLKAVGLPPPSDVDWEVPSDGCVSDVRAVLVWRRGPNFTGLVDRKCASAADDRLIPVSPSTPALEIAGVLKDRIERLE